MVSMNEMVTFVVLIALAALIAGASALALSDFSAGLTADSAAQNVTTNGLNGLLNLSAQLPTIGTIVGVAVLIGIVISAFAFARQ